MKELTSLKKEKQNLQSIIAQIEYQSKNWLQGTLRVSPNKGYYRYYHYVPAADKKPAQNRHLTKNELGIARQLAQQDYERVLLRVARRQLRILERHPGEYDPHALQDVYQNLHEGRKVLVMPLVMSDEDYIRQWESVQYVPGTFDARDPFFLSERGERVRSKSEKIIADKYLRRGIPYRYEFPMKLMDGKKEIIRRPDFIVLDKRTRKEYIHEHFGKVDDPDYAKHQLLEKLALYAENGIFPGVNLLMTMESSQYAFNDRYLDHLIKQYRLAD